MMDELKFYKTFSLVFAIFLAFFCVLFFYIEFKDKIDSTLSQTIEYNTNNISNITEASIIEECKNWTLLSDIALCLKNKITPVYKYVVRNETIKPFSYLVENGGDCYDWNMLYAKLAKEIGVNANTLTFPMDSKVSHLITIISDNDEYCVLDQINQPRCYKIKK